MRFSVPVPVRVPDPPDGHHLPVDGEDEEEGAVGGEVLLGGGVRVRGVGFAGMRGVFLPFLFCHYYGAVKRWVFKGKKGDENSRIGVLYK